MDEPEDLVEPDDAQYGAADDQYETEIPEEDPNTVSPTAAGGETALPDTAGFVAPAMALPMLALLVAGGIFARLVRR